jgi:hypothetical protein
MCRLAFTKRLRGNGPSVVKAQLELVSSRGFLKLFGEVHGFGIKTAGNGKVDNFHIFMG